MGWTVLGAFFLVLLLAAQCVRLRRAELRAMAATVAEVTEARTRGSHKAQLQYPHIDLSRCIGCGTCVAACPEDGVIGMVHGQAAVIHGARCIGHGLCAEACGPGAISVTLEDVSNRRDLPALTAELEVTRVPNLFLAGEVTGYALIRTAIAHGTAVATEVAKRTAARSPAARTRKKKVMAAVGAGAAGDLEEVGEEVLDLCIVGAGPAGFACSLQARLKGLQFVTLAQEELGGTVAKYPRRKLVMTQPVELPLHGKLKRNRYSKEELMELWQRIAETHELPIHTGEELVDLERDAEGVFTVKTREREFRARHVCLALGRRGTPRKLGVPGEELPKVAYSLLDAQSYQGRRILVVGGGDSAIEAALGLAGQPGNEVTLSYRKDGFFRIRSKNEQRLERCIADGRIQPLFRSEVVAIHPDSVDLEVRNGQGPVTTALQNDEVFVMVGGTPPLDLLKRSGVSFDKELRATPDPVAEEGTGLVRALSIGFCLSLIALAWAIWHRDYYGLPAAERATHLKHVFLRPGLGVGLWLGIASAAMICVNLVYLARRSPRVRFNLGSLRMWMTSHVATGILALLCAMLHGAMTPRDTPGGHAFYALAILLVTGAIGRYFYAWVPRAANGRELEVEEVKARLAAARDRGVGHQKFREEAHTEVVRLTDARWKGSFAGRLFGLLGVRRNLHRALDRLASRGLEDGVPTDQIRQTLDLARRAHRASLVAAHYEDLRALLNTWRYLHRWVAVLMVIFVVVHIVRATSYGSIYFNGGTG